MRNDWLTVLENERRYVAKELHDGVAQTTLQLGLQAGICRKLAERGDTDMLDQELATLEDRIHLASNQIREMISDMRPPAVEEDTLLSGYIQHVIEIHRDRSGPPIDYQCSALPSLSQPETLTLIRILQEGLLNIRKHAQAQNIRLTFSETEHCYLMELSDDGQGFEGSETEPIEQAQAGLSNMQARARAIGGSLKIARDPVREWTKLTLALLK